MNIPQYPKWVLLLFLFSLLQLPCFSLSYHSPLNCSDTVRVCTSFISFKPNPNETFQVIQSMFDVLPQDITLEGDDRGYVFIRKNCSCSPYVKKYLTNTTFTVRQNGGSVHNMVIDGYQGLALLPNYTRAARAGAVVSIQLFCGCSSGLWNYLMSYVMKEGDSIESLASRFGVSMDSIEALNGLTNPDNVTVGDLYYVPLNSVPGEPYPTESLIPPTSAPAPAHSADQIAAEGKQAEKKSKSHKEYGWILGCLGLGLAVILVLVIVIFICLRSSSCDKGGSNPNGENNGVSHKFQILRNTSFCCASGRYNICRKSGEINKQANGESSDRQINVPKALGNDVFDMEKPLVFGYEEITTTTDGFSDSHLLGHGTYGSVYHGVLRGQDVAIKRMTETKSKEFLAELKVLGKVHHANLVELIGYAATDDELFLIYEYAQKGSLGNHLHDPQSKGHTSLSWIMRLQIALDAARGLEYIHEHTRPHYVHRDIKTSNILLDDSFRGKVSDFGLAKLAEITNDAEASVTRVVGTFGYVAPEYLRDCVATKKSDVYAFGVVLLEMISGKEAVTRSQGNASNNHNPPEQRRSLVSIMVSALKNTADHSKSSMSSFKDYIDPNMMDLYPHDCVFKAANLAKQCVDDDPIMRPDMKQIVMTLSQILLSSIEWEATLAGNSQVFSGLVQGR
ncbi:lysM domain receptor-like kinase 3 [Impatiens glandulifera]|uniref:lysM domain receptor-like kinase 3 n=1 Tax=Impatiens glandulifera TaxID=253017 RepID=UPI001FB06BC1|nr:lysM domain receptor-like kinase 3 [Impatiens glandulifera]